MGPWPGKGRIFPNGPNPPALYLSPAEAGQRCTGRLLGTSQEGLEYLVVGLFWKLRVHLLFCWLVVLLLAAGEEDSLPVNPAASSASSHRCWVPLEGAQPAPFCWGLSQNDSAMGFAIIKPRHLLDFSSPPKCPEPK